MVELVVVLAEQGSLLCILAKMAGLYRPHSGLARVTIFDTMEGNQGEPCSLNFRLACLWQAERLTPLKKGSRKVYNYSKIITLSGISGQENNFSRAATKAAQCVSPQSFRIFPPSIGLLSIKLRAPKRRFEPNIFLALTLLLFTHF